MNQIALLFWLFWQLSVQIKTGDLIRPVLFFTWIEINYKDRLVKRRRFLKRFVSYLIAYHNLQTEASESKIETQQEQRNRERLVPAFNVKTINPEDFNYDDATILIADVDAVLNFIKSDEKAVKDFKRKKSSFKFHNHCGIIYKGKKLYIIEPMSHNTYYPGRVYVLLANTIRELLWFKKDFITVLVDSPLEDVINYFYLTLLLQYKFTGVKISSLLYFERDGVDERLNNRLDLMDFNKRYGIAEYCNDPFLPALWVDKKTTLNEIVSDHTDDGQKLLPKEGKSFIFTISERIRSFTSNFRQKEISDTYVPDLSEAEKDFISSCKISDEKYQHELRILLKSVDLPDTSILLMGETGVGKTFIAKNLHKHSNRKDKSFIHLNCSTIPSTLIESELFGAEPYSFTGANRKGTTGKIEAADGGILFLDEITEASQDIQAKLLTFLDDGTFYKIGGTKPRKSDVRLIFAFNHDLKTAIKERKLRHDLYYRISAASFTVPSLRARKDDLDRMIKHVFEEIRDQHNLSNLRLPNESLEYLKNLTWPGNVRQLRNQMKVSIIDCSVRGCDTLNMDILKSHYNSVLESGQLKRLETILEEYFLLWEVKKSEILEDPNFRVHFKSAERDSNYIDGFIKPVLAKMYIDKYEDTYKRKEVFKSIGMSWEKENATIVKNSQIYPIIKRYFND